MLLRLSLVIAMCGLPLTAQAADGAAPVLPSLAITPPPAISSSAPASELEIGSGKYIVARPGHAEGAAQSGNDLGRLKQVQDAPKRGAWPDTDVHVSLHIMGAAAASGVIKH